MYYPWWYVPLATSPMLIAAIAVVHVLVSHYAVGGGLFLATETAFAYRTSDTQYLDYLKRHTRFFVLLTVVFGAITGVGIWWTIGLASPLATEVLIRTFVFGWATEWVFFIVEIVSAFVFLYYWGRLPPKTHATIGWIYAIAAWVSLVLITGITGFMLNPGAWLEDHTFWSGFFNPQFLPQTIARTGGALLLSSLYVYLHASITVSPNSKRLSDLVIRRSTRPAMLGAAMVAVGGALWFAFLPESARAVLDSAAVLTVLTAGLFALTATVFALLYIGPYRNPDWVSPAFAVALMVLGIAAFCTGEFIREGVRKPYVLYNVVLSNQIYPSDVASLRKNGYLEGGLWTKRWVKEHYPSVFDGNQIVEERMLGLPEKDKAALGEVLFQYHCNDCHAVSQGYSAMGPLIRGHTFEMNLWTIEHLEKGHFFMPPWAGTPEEAKLLAAYLATITPPRPAGMVPKSSD